MNPRGDLSRLSRKNTANLAVLLFLLPLLQQQLELCHSFAPSAKPFSSRHNQQRHQRLSPFLLSTRTRSRTNSNLSASRTEPPIATTERNSVDGAVSHGDKSAMTSEPLSESPATTATATATATNISWRDDGFVYGLAGSSLQRPTGKVATIVVDGDSLETQPYQQVMVAMALSFHAYVTAASIAGVFASVTGTTAAVMGLTSLLLPTLQCLSIVTLSWILADLGSGILHWSVDNYGNGRTPIMGSIIAAFQGHHSAPWTITQRGFCNNIYKLCLPFGAFPALIIVTMALYQVITGSFAGAASLFGAGTLFLSTFCVWELLSQEFHKWSHQLPRESPRLANILQKFGLAVDRKSHALHHTAPFEGYYCIISGVCNKFLDESGFFRRLEYFIYKYWTGVEANAWKLDPVLRERTLRGDFAWQPSTSSVTSTASTATTISSTSDADVV